VSNPTPPFQELTSTAWQAYQQQLSTTQLQQPVGTAIEMALAAQKDFAADRVRMSLKARLPQNAPPDGLTQIGIERGMPQGTSESGSAYASRLQDAWNAWPWAGTAFGLLRAFYATGYTNVVLAQVRGGKQFTLDTGATNTFLWSVDLTNSAWTKRGTCAIAKNAAVAPDGTTTAAQVTGLNAAGVNDFFQNVGAFGAANGTSYDPSFWIQRVSGSGTLSILNPNGSGGNATINLATIGAGWVRIDPGAPVAGVAVGTAFTVAAGTTGLQFYAFAGGPLSFNIWMPQNEIGATAAGTVTPTYGVAKTTALAAGSLLTSTMASGIWETDPLSSYSPANQTFWSKFTVLFPLPLMPPNFTWSAGIPASSSAESNFIRALIQAWKPAHATCNAIVIGQQGQVWGYPATQLWGASNGVWGGSNTVWTP
jgi:hypothetical protein